MHNKTVSLLRLAWPYLVMILLPVLSVLILCGYILNSATEKAVADQDAAISEAIDRVDRKLDAVEELSYLVGESEVTKNYIFNAMSGTENDLFDSKGLRNLISGISKNDSIAEIYFYDCYSGSIISTSNILSDSSLYFAYNYRDESVTPQEELDRLQASGVGAGYSPVRTVLIHDRRRDVIEYRLSMLPGQYGQNVSQLTIALDTARVFQDFSDVLFRGAEFYVYDGDRLMFASGSAYADLNDLSLTDHLEKTPTTHGTVYALDRVCSQNMWHVRFYYPRLSSSEQSGSALLLLLPAILIPLLLSVGMCVYFTHKNHQEIAETLALFRGDAEEQEPEINYSLVRRYAGEMVRENSAYKAHFSEIRASSKRSILSRLVRGAFRNNAELQRELDVADLQVTGKCAAMSVQFDRAFSDSFTIGDRSMPDMIADILVTHLGLPVEVFEHLPTEVVCIFAADGDFSVVTDTLVSLLHVYLSYQYGIDLRIGIGDPVESISEISRSYDQANEVIRYAESTGKTIYLHEQLDHLDEIVFYPLSADDRISNYIIAGRGDQANEIIADIFRENFQNETKTLSLASIDILKYRVTSTVSSVAEKQGVPMPTNMRLLLTEKNIKTYFRLLSEAVTAIAEEIMAKKNKDQNALAVQVHEYVKENFSDPALSVKEIAKHFHFHENYMSNQYKEEYNENLSTAIERLRIEKACELLRSSDSFISEIAGAVGYSSDSSFRRAFKKVTGISPADYRDSF